MFTQPRFFPSQQLVTGVAIPKQGFESLNNVFNFLKYHHYFQKKEASTGVQ